MPIDFDNVIYGADLVIDDSTGYKYLDPVCTYSIYSSQSIRPWRRGLFRLSGGYTHLCQPGAFCIGGIS